MTDKQTNLILAMAEVLSKLSPSDEEDLQECINEVVKESEEKYQEAQKQKESQVTKEISGDRDDSHGD